MKTIDHPHQTQQDDFLLKGIDIPNIIIHLIIKNKISLSGFEEQLSLLSLIEINEIHVFLKAQCKKEGLYCDFFEVASKYLKSTEYNPNFKFLLAI